MNRNLATIAVLGLAQAANAQEGYFLTGLVRDFHETHPAMETTNPDRVALNLGPLVNGDPTWTGNGQKIASPWRDVVKNDIAPVLYNASLGDTEGSFAHPDSAGYTAASFDSIWDDVLGENLSQAIPFRMVQQPSGIFEFSSDNFYPADNILFGEEGKRGHNQYFAVEWHLSFVAEPGQWFQFKCDDEVFVYVNGIPVIDLAGKVASHVQLALFDRLNLTAGETYKVDIFYADRHSQGNSVEIQTNVRFDGLPLNISGAYD